MKQTNGEILWAALPGTTRELVAKTGLYVKRVRALLRVWQDEGAVEQKTRHFGSLAYTFVYYPTTNKRPEGL
jgi:transcription initiation factor IIE alpha subunit